jgi:hypothetical protein
MLPWFSNLIDEDRALLGDDRWPYGIQRNRSAIDVVLRYHHEQGLTKRRLAMEDVFFPDLPNRSGQYGGTHHDQRCTATSLSAVSLNTPCSVLPTRS